MTETFDVGFEKYIIFHRGIQKIEWKDVTENEGEENERVVNHLFIIYQDGYEQDIGDPYGDQTRESADDAEIAQAAAETAQAAAEQARADINETYQAAIDAGTAATAKYNEATAKATEASGLADQATAQFNELSDIAVQTIHNINGIVEDPNTHEFYVVIPSEVTNEQINNLFQST